MGPPLLRVRFLQEPSKEPALRGSSMGAKGAADAPGDRGGVCAGTSPSSGSFHTAEGPCGFNCVRMTGWGSPLPARIRQTLELV